VKIHQDKRGRSCDGPVKIHRALIFSLHSMRAARICGFSRGSRPADRGADPMSVIITERHARRWIAGELVNVTWFSVEVFNEAGKLRSYTTTNRREDAEAAAAKWAA
jgi:hypothetical protein